LILETVAEGLGASLWPEPMRSQLLEIQYVARRTSVRTNFPDGESRIIMLNDRNAGWYYLGDRPEYIHIVEIMVLAELRGKGVGTAAIRQTIADSERTRKPLTLGVSATNVRAIRLYERLGFRRAGGDDVQHAMERSPHS
jgi:ribosomal protein S18 acetylase RimI-like enzyme